MPLFVRRRGPRPAPQPPDGDDRLGDFFVRTAQILARCCCPQDTALTLWLFDRPSRQALNLSAAVITRTRRRSFSRAQ